VFVDHFRAQCRSLTITGKLFEGISFPWNFITLASWNLPWDQFWRNIALIISCKTEGYLFDWRCLRSRRLAWKTYRQIPKSMIPCLLQNAAAIFHSEDISKSLNIFILPFSRALSVSRYIGLQSGSFNSNHLPVGKPIPVSCSSPETLAMFGNETELYRKTARKHQVCSLKLHLDYSFKWAAIV
jgi:hypothetical protein